MSFGATTKQVPTQTPYFQQIQQLLAQNALGAKTPTMPGLFSTAGPPGSGGGPGQAGGFTMPASTGTVGSNPISLIQQMLNAGGGSAAAPGAAPASGGVTSGPGGVTIPSGGGGINQIFNPGSSIPQGSVPSLDNILQTETGANSVFTNTILPALTKQFADANAQTMAAAKESAGNLTGSGFANTLGIAAGRSATTQGADIAQILSSLGQNQEATQNTDLLAQYQAQNSAQSQNAAQFAQLMQMIFGGGQSNTAVIPGWSSMLPGLADAAAKVAGG